MCGCPAHGVCGCAARGVRAARKPSVRSVYELRGGGVGVLASSSSERFAGRAKERERSICAEPEERRSDGDDATADPPKVEARVSVAGASHGAGASKAPTDEI
eukprot:2816331-Pleurochrysis_carterae.AAC.2